MAFTQNLQEKQIQIKYLFLKQVVTSLIQFVDLQKYFANIRALVLYSITKGVKRRVSTMYFCLSSSLTTYIHG